MKQVAVVGIGVGTNTLTFEALEAMNEAEVLLGAPRILEIVSDLYKGAPKRIYPYFLPKDTAGMVNSEEANRFAVLVSGDVGFYSAATGLADALTGTHGRAANAVLSVCDQPAYDVQFIPGISTVNIFFAKLKLPWQNAAFISVHGRETNIVDTVRRNRFVFCLTGNNVNDIGTVLTRAGFGQIKTYIGENLGTDLERVYEVVAKDLTQGQFPSMTVLLFQNDEFDEGTPCGLPDIRFSRLEGIPMTKSETRAVLMSKLNLSPSSICYDIGAGTGSVTVEMALAAYHGHVYAVERREDAIPLINQNCALFHIGNVTPICGEAPAALDSLPAPDAVFIGGSGGEIGNIISIVLNKNPNARIVITAVTLETVSLSLTIFKNIGIEPEIAQISFARGKSVGKLHMMEAQNPITILCAGGEL